LENSNGAGRDFLKAIEIFRLRETGVQNKLPVDYLVNRKPQKYDLARLDENKS
jgi:hypothetical protein